MRCQRRPHEASRRDVATTGRSKRLFGGADGAQAAVEHLDQENDPDRHHQAGDQTTQDSRRAVVRPPTPPSAFSPSTGARSAARRTAYKGLVGPFSCNLACWAMAPCNWLMATRRSFCHRLEL